jgi:hypothetical protein
METEFHSVICIAASFALMIMTFMLLECGDTIFPTIIDMCLYHLTYVTRSSKMSTFRPNTQTIHFLYLKTCFVSNSDKNPMAHLDHVASYLNDLSIRMESRLTNENITSKLVLCSVDVFQRE